LSTLACAATPEGAEAGLPAGFSLEGIAIEPTAIVARYGGPEATKVELLLAPPRGRTSPDRRSILLTQTPIAVACPWVAREVRGIRRALERIGTALTDLREMGK